MTITTAQSRIAAKTLQTKDQKQPASASQQAPTATPRSSVSLANTEDELRDSFGGFIGTATKRIKSPDVNDRNRSTVMDEYTETLHAEQDYRLRQQLSAQEYLERYGVQHYLSDVITLLLDSGTDAPLDLIARQFQGTHVIHRNFEYIQATPRNRLAFFDLFEEMYAQLSDSRVLSCNEYFQLVCQVCSDFPKRLVKIVYKASVRREQGLGSNDDAASNFGDSSEEIDFKTFKSSFKSFFFFSEFFFLILETIYDNDIKHELDSITLTSKLKSLSRSCQEFSFDALTPRTTSIVSNSVKNKFGSSICVISAVTLENAIQNYCMGQLPQKPNTQRTLSFFTLFKVVTSYIELKCEGNVLKAMDRSKLPIALRFAERQKDKMKENICNLLSSHDQQAAEQQRQPAPAQDVSATAVAPSPASSAPIVPNTSVQAQPIRPVPSMSLPSKVAPQPSARPLIKSSSIRKKTYQAFESESDQQSSDDDDVDTSESVDSDSSDSVT